MTWLAIIWLLLSPLLRASLAVSSSSAATCSLQHKGTPSNQHRLIKRDNYGIFQDLCRWGWGNFTRTYARQLTRPHREPYLRLVRGDLDNEADALFQITMVFTIGDDPLTYTLSSWYDDFDDVWSAWIHEAPGLLGERVRDILTFMPGTASLTTDTFPFTLNHIDVRLDSAISRLRAADIAGPWDYFYIVDSRQSPDPETVRDEPHYNFVRMVGTGLVRSGLVGTEDGRVVGAMSLAPQHIQ